MGASTAPKAAAGRATPPANQADPKLFAGASQAAAESSRRAAEATCGLVEGEALEVAKHHGKAEYSRQAVDLAMNGLGLLTIDCRPVG